MREVISINIGQAGIQSGNACWEVRFTLHVPVNAYYFSFFFALPVVHSNLIHFVLELWQFLSPYLAPPHRHCPCALPSSAAVLPRAWHPA